MRGRNKIQKKLNRKNKNIIDENKVKLKEKLEEQKAEREAERNRKNSENEGAVASSAPKALKRFFK